MVLNTKSRFIILCFAAIKYVTADQKCDSLVSEGNETIAISTILTIAGNLLNDAKERISQKKGCVEPSLMSKKPMDCAEIYENHKNSKSGVYDVWPRSRLIQDSIKVYCDMDDDGGAWTLIQRRGDFDSGADYFYKDWAAYKAGFGDLLKDFWLGNDIIFALTNQRENLVKFVLTDWEGNVTYATYDQFWIDDENNKYTMHVKSYRGTAGDSFSGTNGVPFSTKDVDNDTHDSSCATMFKGAWWYTSCHASNLNGYYLKGAHESHADGVEWHGFRGHYYSLKDSFIKIRPITFKKNVTPS